jgi:hypothetical protein
MYPQDNNMLITFVKPGMISTHELESYRLKDIHIEKIIINVDILISLIRALNASLR